MVLYSPDQGAIHAMWLPFFPWHNGKLKQPSSSNNWPALQLFILFSSCSTPQNGCFQGGHMGATQLLHQLKSFILAS